MDLGGLTVIDFLDKHPGATTALLTAVLVLITAFYAFQNWRMAVEMRRSRETAILPRLALGFYRLGRTAISTEIRNVGPGAALSVDVELTYIPIDESAQSESRRVRYPLLASGHYVDLFPPGELNDNLNHIPATYKSITLRGSMFDAAGNELTVKEEFGDLAEWRKLLGDAKQRFVDPSAERRLAEAFASRFKTETKSATSDLSRISASASAIATHMREAPGDETASES